MIRNSTMNLRAGELRLTQAFISDRHVLGLEQLNFERLNWPIMSGWELLIFLGSNWDFPVFSWLGTSVSHFNFFVEKSAKLFQPLSSFVNTTSRLSSYYKAVQLSKHSKTSSVLVLPWKYMKKASNNADKKTIHDHSWNPFSQ